MSKKNYTVHVHFIGRYGLDSYVVSATNAKTAAEKVFNRVFDECGYDTVSDISCCIVQIKDLTYGYDVIVHGDENGVCYEMTDWNKLNHM